MYLLYDDAVYSKEKILLHVGNVRRSFCSKSCGDTSTICIPFPPSHKHSIILLSLLFHLSLQRTINIQSLLTYQTLSAVE